MRRGTTVSTRPHGEEAVKKWHVTFGSLGGQHVAGTQDAPLCSAAPVPPAVRDPCRDTSLHFLSAAQVPLVPALSGFPLSARPPAATAPGKGRRAAVSTGREGGTGRPRCLHSCAALPGQPRTKPRWPRSPHCHRAGAARHPGQVPAARRYPTVPAAAAGR